MTTMSGPSADASPPRRRLWAAVRAVAIVAIVAGSAAAVYAERSTISSGLASFRQSNPAWVAAGFGAECISMAAFALLQQRLLRAAGTALTFGSLLAIAYTSTAVALAIPVAGSGMATAYAQRQFRARGADTAMVGLALLIAGVISTVAFAVIVALGAMASGSPAAALAGLLTSACCAAAAGLIVVILHSKHAAGYGFGLDVTALAYVGLANTTAIVLGAMTVPRLVKRLGHEPSIYSACLAMLAGYTGLAIWHGTLWQVIAASSVSSLGMGLIASAMAVVLTERASTGSTGISVGLYITVRAVGGSIAGAGFAVLLTRATMVDTVTPREWAYVAVWLTCALASLLSLLIVAAARPKRSAQLSRAWRRIA